MWGSNCTGFLVLGLDYFEGDSKALLDLDDETFDYPAWQKRHQVRAAVLIPPWIEAVRERFGTSPSMARVGRL